MDPLQLAAKEEKAIGTINLEAQRNTCTWETDSWAIVIRMLAAKTGMKCVGQVMLIFLSHYLYKHFTTQKHFANYPEESLQLQVKLWCYF